MNLKIVCSVLTASAPSYSDVISKKFTLTLA